MVNAPGDLPEESLPEGEDNDIDTERAFLEDFRATQREIRRLGLPVPTELLTDRYDD